MGQPNNQSRETAGASATAVADATTRPTVAVVIPAYTMDRWELLRKGVESARRQTAPVDEVVVAIDNNDELLALAKAEWRDAEGVPVRVLANRHDDHLTDRGFHERAYGTSRRYGAGAARNTAVEIVSADIVAFMDDDAWAEPEWIQELVELYRDPSIVAVGGAPQPDYETSRPVWFPANFDWVFGCAYEGLPTTAAPLRHLIGSNMSVRREALLEIGGFMGSDFDDLNVCMRLAGRYGDNRLYYAPRAIVYHHVPASRVSWRYFWRRCYFVNRDKVAAFRRMGAAANLVAERDFVLRSLKDQVQRELRRGLARKPGALRSLAAMLAGIALAGAGHAVGRIGQFGRRGQS